MSGNKNTYKMELTKLSKSDMKYVFGMPGRIYECSDDGSYFYWNQEKFKYLPLKTNKVRYNTNGNYWEVDAPTFNPEVIEQFQKLLTERLTMVCRIPKDRLDNKVENDMMI